MTSTWMKWRSCSTAWIACSALACSSPGAGTAPLADASAPDVVADAPAPACDPGDAMTRGGSDDCVALGGAGPCCAGFTAYRCDQADEYSEDTPRGAHFAAGGVACAGERECARAKRYDARCESPGGAWCAIAADGGCAAEAYSCPLLDDGGVPEINVLHECFPLGGAAPPGEGPIVCCP